MAAEMVGDSLGGEAMAGGWEMVGDVAFGGEEVAEEVGGVAVGDVLGAVADEGAGGFRCPGTEPGAQQRGEQALAECASGRQCFQAAATKQSQPAMSTRPPSGVIAPSQRAPVRLSR